MRIQDDTAPATESADERREFFDLQRHGDRNADLDQFLDAEGGGCSSNSNSGCCNSNASGDGDNP